MPSHRTTTHNDLILDACLTVFTETGFEALTLQSVAYRAGVQVGVIADRWRDRGSLVVAAFDRVIQRAGAADADTGGLRGDLLYQCQLLATGLQDIPARSLAVLAEAHHNHPSLCDALERAHGGIGARLPAAVLERARMRGELPLENPGTAYAEVVAPVLVTRLVAEQRVDDRFVESLIDDFVLPAYRHAGDPFGLSGVED